MTKKTGNLVANEMAALQWVIGLNSFWQKNEFKRRYPKMKKSVFSAIVVSAMLIASALFAQDKSFRIMVGGGIGSPATPDQFNDSFNLGVTGQAGVDYAILSHFTIGANFAYNRFGLDQDNFLGSIGMTGSDVSLKGGNLNIYEITGLGKYNLMQTASRTNFYILAGPGVAISKNTNLTLTTPEGTTVFKSGSESDFILTGGIGAIHKLSPRWSLFAEARYSYIFARNNLNNGENASYLPVRVGVTF